MKIKTILTSLFLVASLTIFAQADIDAQVKKMTTTVNLTAEQQVKYKNYLISKQKETEQFKEKFKNDNGSEAMTKAQNEFKAKFKKQLDAILTPEQLEKIKAANEAARKKSLAK